MTTQDLHLHVCVHNRVCMHMCYVYAIELVNFTVFVFTDDIVVCIDCSMLELLHWAVNTAIATAK